MTQQDKNPANGSQEADRRGEDAGEAGSLDMQNEGGSSHPDAETEEKRKS